MTPSPMRWDHGSGGRDRGSGNQAPTLGIRGALPVPVPLGSKWGPMWECLLFWRREPRSLSHSESGWVLPGPHGEDFIAAVPDVAAGDL